MEDCAVYLARRMRHLYDLSAPAEEEELLRVCEERGATVYRSLTLAGPGYYLPWPDPVIVLRWNASPWVLAHELYHHIVTENQGYGVVYAFPEFVDSDLEEQAQLFAWLLCSPSSETEEYF